MNKWTKIRIAVVSAIVVVALLVGGIQIGIKTTQSDVKTILRVGNPVEAAGITPDYVGIDSATVQTALNALPGTGGEIDLISTAYTFTFTVSCPINNVTIKGNNGTTVSNDGVTALFTVGAQTGWKFQDLITDAGGITNSANATLENVTLGTAFYAYHAPSGTSGSSFVAPVGRSATIVVAASDATATEKAQADYVCSATGNQTTFATAIGALPAGGGDIQLLSGHFSVSAATTITTSNIHIILSKGATITLADGSNSDIFDVTGVIGTHVTGFQFEGGIIDGNKAGNAGSIYAIGLSYVEDSLIQNATFQNATSYAIYENANYLPTNVIARNCKFLNNNNGVYNLTLAESCVSNGEGIPFYGTSLSNVIVTDYTHGSYLTKNYSYVTHSKFIAKAGSSVTGINLEYSMESDLSLKHIKVDYNNFDGTGATLNAAVGVTPNSGTIAVDDVKISHNFIKVGVNPIEIGAHAGIAATMKNIDIDYNTFDSPTSYPIFIFINNVGSTADGVRVGVGNRYINLATAPFSLQGDHITLEELGQSETTANLTHSNSWSALESGLQVMSFNGTTEYAQYDAKIIPVGAMTITAWVKVVTNANHRTIIDENSESLNRWGIQMGVTTAHKLYAAYWNNDGTSWNTTGSGVTSVDDNLWHFVVLTWDGLTTVNGVKVYIDGILDHQATSADVISHVASYNTAIGSLTGTNIGVWTMNGLMTTPKVYNYVLSLAQISYTYTEEGASIKP